MKAAEFRTYLDSEITFFMQTYNEGEYAFNQAAKIRQFYPEARLVVRSDGGRDLGLNWNVIQAEFFQEERLFPITNGGKAIQRMLDIFFLKPSHFLVKVDPDSVFHRRLCRLPTRNGLFGTMQELDGCTSIQGGFIGMSYSAARRIHQSHYLLSPVLSRPIGDHGGYMAILHRRGQRVGLASFDWSLGWSARKLGISMFDLMEVCCLWKSPPENADMKFAVTHPDPLRITSSKLCSKTL